MGKRDPGVRAGRHGLLSTLSGVSIHCLRRCGVVLSIEDDAARGCGVWIMGQQGSAMPPDLATESHCCPLAPLAVFGTRTPPYSVGRNGADVPIDGQVHRLRAQSVQEFLTNLRVRPTVELVL